MTKEEFWSKQYKSHIGKMVGVCYRYVGDWQVAEDLAQDAFLKAMEKGSTFHGWGSFEGWLKKIAVNEALMNLRSQPEMVEMSDGITVENPLPEEPLEMEPAFSQEELLDAISKLPAMQRAVFNLYAVDQYSHKQIARALDISEVNSKVLLNRARGALQARLMVLAAKRH